MIYSQNKGNNDDPVDTVINLETNVMKNTELSTSLSVARQFPEIQMIWLIQKKKWLLMT